MTVSSGFFNSVNHDRLYDADQMSSIFDGIIEDGVYESIGEAFMVTAYPDANDTVIVGTGRAWFDHTWTLNDTQFSITLSPPNTLLGRIDSIVIDVDRRDSVRKNSIILVEGEYAESPVPPTLANEELHKQYPIANIQVDAGASGPVSQSKITYLVGTDPCPIVTGPLEAFNISNYFQQMESEFEIWFEGVKDILDTNVAMDLQNQINELKNNQTVSDSGEIGDFTILMTSAMIEALKTRGNKMHFSSKAIPQRSYSEVVDITFDYTDPPGSPEHPYTGYRHYSSFSKSFPYNQSFFLPNGTVARVSAAPYYENFSSGEKYGNADGGAFFLDIITQEGVVTTYNSDPISYSVRFAPNDPNMQVTARPDNIYFNGMMVISYDYPVKIVCSMVLPSQRYRYYDIYGEETGLYYGFGVGSCLITITEENVVTFSAPGKVFHIFNTSDSVYNSNDVKTGYILSNTHAFETPNKELVFANSSYNHWKGSNGQMPQIPEQYTENVSTSVIYKVDSAGTLSSTDIVNLWLWLKPGRVNTVELLDTDNYYYTAYASQDGFVYLDLGTDTNVSTRNHFIKINPNDLSYSYYTGTIPGTIYYPEITGEAQYYTNKIVKKRSWSNYKTHSDSDVMTYDPLVLFSSNKTTIDSAILCKLFDINNTLILAAINTGDNCRGIFAGKNGVGFYGENVASSLSNADKINLDRLARNSRRIIETENSITLLFDDSTVEMPKQGDALKPNNSSSSNNARNTSNMYIIKIWYDMED